MSKSKSQSKKKKTEQPVILNFDSDVLTKYKVLLILTVLILPVILAGYYVYFAFGVNSFFSFPLDDPWIHLTFASNIAEYHSFSYYKNELITAGSTSPLYTIILGIGFLVMSNEMLLSYALGIIFFAGACVSMYFISRNNFGSSSWLALLCTGIFIFDKWMNFISVSGMETTMYIMLLLVGAYFYQKRKPVPAGVILGLILWTRPDGVAFVGAVAVHYIYTLYVSQKGTDGNLFSQKDFVKMVGAFALIIFIYFGLNLYLSGSLLPNTYNAKLTYYSPEFRSRADFLKFEVWDYFTAGSYVFLMAGALLSVVFIVKDVFAKKRNEFLLYLVFILSFIFIYWYKLPYAHRFGRYLMPVIPFLILLAVYGFRNSAVYIARSFRNSQFAKGVTVMILLVTLLYSFFDYRSGTETYAYECKYIYDRHVKAAIWLNENTNENDIIGTHDVGAIGFYSKRKIIDAAGLITPELIDKLHSPEYTTYMKQYMKDNDVSYLAFLREWYRVVNIEPLFSTKDVSPVEVMEIFRFEPDTLLILSSLNRSMIMFAEDALGRQMPQQALNVLQKSIQEEPNSSLAYFMLSYTYALMGDEQKMEQNLLRAIELHPNYVAALVQLGNLNISRNNYPEAKDYLLRALNIEPENTEIIGLFQKIPGQESTVNGEGE